MRSNALTSLEIVKGKLADAGIQAEISTVRANTPGAYDEIVIDDISVDVLAVRKMLNGVGADLHLEIGYYKDLDGTEYPILQIRPRYSYLLESERKKLFYE